MSQENEIEIWASIGVTKNLGNYESLRLDAGARIKSSSVEDDKAWDNLWAAIDAQIEAKLQELDNGTSK